MMQLVFPATMLLELLSELRKSKKEAAAIVLAQPVHFAESNSWRLLVREHHVVPGNDYDIRSPTEVQPSSQFLVSCESRARKNGWSIVYCHSHPGATGLPIFSRKDDRTEKLLARYLGERFPDIPHISLLVGRERATELPDIGRIRIGPSCIRWEIAGI